jgi:hypothetical protein
MYLRRHVHKLLQAWPSGERQWVAVPDSPQVQLLALRLAHFGDFQAQSSRSVYPFLSALL